MEKSPSQSLRCILTAPKDEMTKLYVLYHFRPALLDPSLPESFMDGKLTILLIKRISINEI